MSPEKLLRNEFNNKQQTDVLRAACQAMIRGDVLFPEQLCSKCHAEPIALFTCGGLCAYCADILDF